VDACVPAPGQGIIAIETRTNDDRVRNQVVRIDDRMAGVALRAERAVISRLGGGCQMPIGAYANVTATAVMLTTIVISLDGTRAARAEVEGTAADPEAAGIAAAEQLLARGADEILADVQRAPATVEGLQP
jgi:hydroxymethylbilane synthase